MNIGDVAQRSGVSAKMIRYYESVGLIPPAQRSNAGYREYSGYDLDVLCFIRRLRELGFSVKQMEEMLSLWKNPARSSADVKQLALAHSKALEQKAERLLDMSRQLRQLAAECRGDNLPECAILDGLSAHSCCP